MDKAHEITKQDKKNVKKTRYEATPAVDIYENENEILLHADMPGVVKEDISVDIDNGTLSISGVRHLTTKGTATYEEFSDVEYVRNFSVPQTINVEKVEAELKNGVLRLHLPKSEAAKPRQIEIKTA
ncbi:MULTISPECIES: Hsp20/alpha crystallin family protein [Desulfobacula]|uniref:Heat shock protein, Hsp 20 family n=2 Tax=Desulfobacula TaxID=28222 RepID=K0NJ03_DESTT|nr:MULTISPECIES: Hsp20/alpha crystallin family protein [Desulfobacula]CCK79843.1 heat shock protein, Hsp 20 family [Desulfobacula toluolica Tol2]SDU20825.1 Molecular chaperone IbpA, HSP20 family [Desulfobacula phenolica]